MKAFAPLLLYKSWGWGQGQGQGVGRRLKIIEKKCKMCQISLCIGQAIEASPCSQQYYLVGFLHLCSFYSKEFVFYEF